MQQLPLLPSGDDTPFRRSDSDTQIPVERFEGALVFAAVGDALGWPTEFGRYPSSVGNGRAQNGFRLTEFVSWRKVIGGKFWGYEEIIEPGEYSDDTQLTLSMARCIDQRGHFDANKFAYLEMPLWLEYEKGGGKSLKIAARSLARSHRGEWPCVFYRQRSGDQVIDYREAGANGAAMRILPIALAHAAEGEMGPMLHDVIRSAIVTHGHPRALIGAMLQASLAHFLIRQEHVAEQEVLTFLSGTLESFTGLPASMTGLGSWLTEWDAARRDNERFRDVFGHTLQEARDYLQLLTRYTQHDLRSFYNHVGALSSELRGSGLSTVFAAFFLFLKHYDAPEEGVLSAVNALGSDTDSIAAFVGALFGARFGISCVPQHWLAKLQDRVCFRLVAHRLHGVAHSAKAMHALLPSGESVSNRQASRESLLSAYAWEDRHYELLWDLPAKGELVVHPALGIGTVMGSQVQPLLMRQDYEVRLLSVKFRTGQTCTFHARVVKATGAISGSENLSMDLERNPEVSQSLRALA